MSYHRRAIPSNRGGGFTLIEVMIASVASALLLVGLWAMLTIYTRFLERGQDQARRLQLVRAVHQQLSDDLRSLRFVAERLPQTTSPQIGSGSRSRASWADETTDRPAPQEPLRFGSSSRGSLHPVAEPRKSVELQPKSARRPLDPQSARRPLSAPSFKSPSTTAFKSPSTTAEAPSFDMMDGAATENSFMETELQWGSAQVGLVGTPTTLILDTVVSIGMDEMATSATSPETDSPSRVQELRRIVYTFRNEFEARRTGQPAGLIRSEVPWQSVIEVPSHAGAGAAGSSASKLTARANSASVESPVDVSSGLEQTADWGDPMPAYDRGDEHVPEVLDFLIRYFDGLFWHASWDSRQQNALPVAMEFRFRLTTEERPEEDGTISGVESQSPDLIESSGTTDADLTLDDSQGFLSDEGAATGTVGASETDMGTPGETSRLLLVLRPLERGDVGVDAPASSLPGDVP